MPSSGKKTKNRLRHFMGDGVWASVCEGVAESNFNAYATALLASPSQLSLLASVQNLLGCWLQLWSEKLVAWFGSRKRLVLLLVGLQAFCLALMGVAALLGAGTLVFMGFTLLFAAFGSTAGATWSSWVSDLLPSGRRGFCFGVRNQRIYPISFISLLLAGGVLQIIESSMGGNLGVRLAFCAVFLMGLIAKLLSLRHLSMQPEFPVKLPARTLGPWQLIRVCTQDPPMRNTLAFFAMAGFSICLSGAFQTPYLLKTLHLSYFEFSTVTAAFVLARFFMAPLVGRMVDTMGSRRPFVISAALLPLIAVGWALSGSWLAIIATQIFAGLVWTVFEVTSFTFLAENTPTTHRQRIFAAKQVAWNLASFAGALLGSVIGSLWTLPSLVFWVSCVGRVLAVAVLVGLPREGLVTEETVPEISEAA